MDTLNRQKANIHKKNDDTMVFANEGDIIGDVVLLKNLLRENDLERVFLGFNEELKINVYVKELNHKLYENKEVKCILDILKAVRHSNILKIYDCIEQNDTCYVVMEYVSGVRLKDLLKIQKKTDAEIVKIMSQICDVFNYMSNNKIPHKYINTDNIIVDNANKVFITDCVFSKNYIDGLKKEEKNSKINHSAVDIKNLGDMLYYMVSGNDIPDQNDIILNNNFNEELIDIVNKCLGNNGEGYLSINDFKDDLLSYYEKIEDSNKLSSIVISEEVISKDDYEDDDNKKQNIKKDNYKDIIKKVAVVIITLAVVFLGVAIITRSIGPQTNNYPLVSSVKNNPDKFGNQDGKTYLHNSKNDDVKSDNEDDNESVKGNNYDGDKDDFNNKNKNTNTNGNAKAKLINPNAVSESILGGTVNITITDYAIDDDVIMIKMHVTNNYKSEIEISNDKLHVRNENKNMFLVDKDLMKKNQPDLKKVPSISEKDFTFYFSGYQDSKELVLCIEDILTGNQEEDRNKTLELKFK